MNTKTNAFTDIKKWLWLVMLAYSLLGCIKPQCPEHCQNGLKDNDEKGVDCGGTCLNTCTLKKIMLQPGEEGMNSTVFSLVPDVAWGASINNSAAVWTDQGRITYRKFFINFDYSNMPSSVLIHKATLTLYADTTSDFYRGLPIPKGHSQLSNTNESLLKKITSPWDENTISWNNQPSVSNTKAIYLLPSTSNYQAYVIDVSAFLQEEFDMREHHGFSLELVQKDYYCSLVFYSDDSEFPALKPKLEIEYY